MATLIRRTTMTNYAKLAAEMNNIANAKIELETFINESDRGDRITITIINSNSNERGGWTLDIIQLTEFGKEGQYSTIFDNDMDITRNICDSDNELNEMFARIANGAQMEIDTYAQQED
jgi:hypothetical protein